MSTKDSNFEELKAKGVVARTVRVRIHGERAQELLEAGQFCVYLCLAVDIVKFSGTER
jgi:hypothetical protein